MWDAARGVWHQSWVTNRGTLLLLNGRLEGGRMVLTGSEKTTDGKASLLRGIWWVEGKDVREKAERSTDGGNTWQAYRTPIVQGTPASGIFTVAFRDALHGILAGGDLERDERTRNVCGRSVMRRRISRKSPEAACRPETACSF